MKTYKKKKGEYQGNYVEVERGMWRGLVVFLMQHEDLEDECPFIIVDENDAMISDDAWSLRDLEDF